MVKTQVTDCFHKARRGRPIPVQGRNNLGILPELQGVERDEAVAGIHGHSCRMDLEGVAPPRGGAHNHGVRTGNQVPIHAALRHLCRQRGAQRVEERGAVVGQELGGETHGLGSLGFVPAAYQYEAGKVAAGFGEHTQGIRGDVTGGAVGPGIADMLVQIA